MYRSQHELAMVCRLYIPLTLALLAAPGLAQSQISVTPLSAGSDADRQFAGIGESLASTADAWLVSGGQDTGAVFLHTPVEKEKAVLSMDSQETSMPEGRGRAFAALARLAVLRPAVEPILQEEGVPAELAAVILIESGGRPMAVSAKGARGLWQLMPDTARRYGLRVDAVEDQRLDLMRSTRAAARYLHELYVRFGDWKLALAAYNAGEANISAAMLRARTQNFDRLAYLRLLPAETMNYVPNVFTTMLLLSREKSSRNFFSAPDKRAGQTLFASAASSGN
ncbi:MAG TPA: lytic transglycosylase domain-containing protein [Acidisarcina sp.]|nr:lytic transglycosylase domain-containing protein [Acidisarcina sp.]